MSPGTHETFDHVEDRKPRYSKLNFDFSNSGGGTLEVSQLVTGDVVLVNALELVDLEDESVLVLVCEQSGTTGCSSGGRRLCPRSFY